MPKDKPAVERVVHIRETFEAQLPLIAAILAMGTDEWAPEEIAKDAIELVAAIEAELQ